MPRACLQGEDVFFAATGVSDGDLLQGVRYYSGGASTSSLVMRARSGTGACMQCLRLSMVCTLDRSDQVFVSLQRMLEIQLRSEVYQAYWNATQLHQPALLLLAILIR